VGGRFGGALGQAAPRTFGPLAHPAAGLSGGLNVKFSRRGPLQRRHVPQSRHAGRGRLQRLVRPDRLPAFRSGNIQAVTVLSSAHRTMMRCPGLPAARLVKA
jgi:hypothetical protein